MLFSIIIPVYNVEKYLTECLNSILAQTFNDYELILVDDGSTDSSGDICDFYAQKTEKIKVIHKINGGQAAARNTGTKVAQGEYVLYLDSDDYILSANFLQVLYDNLKGKDVLLYKHQKFFDETKEISPCTYSYSSIVPTDNYEMILRKLVESDAFYGMPWNKTFKRKILIENSVEFESGLTGEDMDWNYKLITNVSSIAVIDKPFIAYRQRVNSVTSSLRLKNLTDFIYILEKWSKKITEEIQSETLKNILLGSVAKYYSNMLITYNRVNEKEKKQYVKQIKDLSWVLKYAMSKRPKIVAKVYRFLGFRLTTVALKLIDKR